jgi:hypothetical protein
MTLRRRLARLEALHPPPSPEERLRMERTAIIYDRWDQLLRDAWPLLDDSQKARVNAAVKQLHEDYTLPYYSRWSPYYGWFFGLLIGWSRLPMLAPETMRDLLLTWVDENVARGFPCRGCGLAYPFRYYSPPDPEAERFFVYPNGQPPPRLPEFFLACPHCGLPNTEILENDELEPQDYPWKHLDGYVGRDALGVDIREHLRAAAHET